MHLFMCMVNTWHVSIIYTASLDINGVPCDSVSSKDKPKDIIFVEPAMLIPAEKTKLDLVDFEASCDIYYYDSELDSNNPGICCERSDGTLSWSPVKVTKECIKAASDSEYASDIVW